jgi:hypothetical protein
MVCWDIMLDNRCDYPKKESDVVLNGEKLTLAVTRKRRELPLQIASKNALIVFLGIAA